MMICEACGIGLMRVKKTFQAGRAKTQERRCTNCRHTSTYILVKHPGRESAYKLAQRLRKEQDGTGSETADEAPHAG